jgi:ParB-like chromosome segregation protein Spo0J
MTYEKYEEQHHIKYVNISDIHITQPNIQANKVKKLLDSIDRLPRINAVQFEDGEISIYDGHHRLIANWAVGNTQIKVNLVRPTKYDASGIDTPNDPIM